MGIYQFGRFRFDAETGVLLVGKQPADVGRRGGRLLKLLLERRGEVVTKQALIDAAWRGAAIEESNLSVQIARLRKLLGTSPVWIETVGRIGYRFLPEPIAAVRAHPFTPSLAVLPLGGEGEKAGEVARALTEDLTIALARFKSLRVIGSSRFEAPSHHDAHYALRGSVRVRDGHIRIGIYLTDGTSGRILWSERLDKVSSAAFAAMDRAVDSFAARVESQVQRAEIDRALDGGQQETADGLFHQARARYLVGRPEDNAVAIALFDRAIALEPGNVQILAGACEARANRISMGWPAVAGDDVARLGELTRHGLALAIDDATARSIFGFALFRTGDRDFGFALVQKAVAMNPNSITALINAGTTNMHWGRIAAAEAQYKRALRLAPDDPNQSHVIGGLSRIRMMQGRFRDALRWSVRALHVNENYGGAHWTRVAASAHLGRMNDARRYLASFQESQAGVSVSSIRLAQPTRAGRMATTLEGLEAAGLSVG